MHAIHIRWLTFSKCQAEVGKLIVYWHETFWFQVLSYSIKNMNKNHTLSLKPTKVTVVVVQKYKCLVERAWSIYLKYRLSALRLSASSVFPGSRTHFLLVLLSTVYQESVSKNSDDCCCVHRMRKENCLSVEPCYKLWLGSLKRQTNI